MLAWALHLKGLRQSYLFDEQGAVRQAILWTDMSFWIIILCSMFLLRRKFTTGICCRYEKLSSMSGINFELDKF